MANMKCTAGARVLFNIFLELVKITTRENLINFLNLCISHLQQEFKCYITHFMVVSETFF